MLTPTCRDAPDTRDAYIEPAPDRVAVITVFKPGMTRALRAGSSSRFAVAASGLGEGVVAMGLKQGSRKAMQRSRC